MLVEAKSKVESSISEAVEKAVASRMQDMQYELEKCTEEKNAVADVNISIFSYTWYYSFKCWNYVSIMESFCRLSGQQESHQKSRDIAKQS